MGFSTLSRHSKLTQNYREIVGLTFDIQFSYSFVFLF
jgi:hypothetical protein